MTDLAAAPRRAPPKPKSACAPHGLDLRGWFTDAEGAWYRQAVADSTGRVVEVGVWRGRSLSYAAPALAGRELTCVDHWRGSTDAWAAGYRAALAAADDAGESVRACFERNMATLGLKPKVLALDSVAAADHVEDGSCGLVFLDASHDGPAVRRDLAAWWPKLRPGGCLAGHDYAPDKHPALVAEVHSFARRGGLTLGRGPDRIWWLCDALSERERPAPQRHTTTPKKLAKAAAARP